ncbi:MAG: GIY-YIG nuclease family protein [Deltaproteobacteria bacterium]|nr:GIY-YIG nuclease family protein [Deltaproteobacteria bacterium]
MDIQKYIKRKLEELTNEIGVYVLCDLDDIPIYVGQSTDGIRARVQRHLTSARSDVIANRQLDVWEVAFVRGYPLPDRKKIPIVEAYLFHQFHSQNPLMNGTMFQNPGELSFALNDPQIIQILPDEEIEDRKRPEVRLPRQAFHYHILVDHLLKVKDKPILRRALSAHFARLKKHHEQFLGDLE